MFGMFKRSRDAKSQAQNVRAQAPKVARDGARSKMMTEADIDTRYSTRVNRNRGTRRAMGAYFNEPYYHRAVEKLISDEIGSYVKITAQSPNADVNKELDRLWMNHERFLDAERRLDFHGILTQCVRERLLKGEVFIVRVGRRSGSLPVPFQIKIISSSMVPDYCQELENGNKIRSGIEFNGNRPVAVHFCKDENEYTPSQRVPMSDVIHCFDALFTGQLRGMPHGTASIPTIGEHSSYLEAVRDDKESRARLGFTLQTEITDDPSNNKPPYRELDEEEEEESPQVEQHEMTNGPSIYKAPDGYKLEAITNNDNGQGIAAFDKAQIRKIAAGLNVPYAVLANDYDGMNDRLIRSVNNDYRREMTGRRERTITHQLVKKLWRWFVDAAVRDGLTIPDYWENRDEYRKCLFTPEVFAYDHPVQDLKAEEMRQKLGVSSPQAFAQSRGENYTEVMEKQAKAKELKKQLLLNE